jgi:glutamate synthase (NADPH/NADH) large chain
VNTEVIGEKANATRPEIEQIMIANSRGVTAKQFEVDLYVIRRRIEKATEQESIKDFYICSLSCRSVIYKGMFLAEQLTAFYPDLLDRRFVSNFAIFHQRYSTNTFPNWWLAQPFRVLAHNGEINTLKGNVNWMRAHECLLASDVLGAAVEDVKPVILPSSSDSAALDAVFELMVRAGRDLPMVKTLMIPETWTQIQSVPQAQKDLYAYCNAVMEPWDGPAAICAFGGRWAIAGMDLCSSPDRRPAWCGSTNAGSWRRAVSARARSSPSTWPRAGSTTTRKSRAIWPRRRRSAAGSGRSRS